MSNPARELGKYYISLGVNTKGMGKDIAKSLGKDFDKGLGDMEKRASKSGTSMAKKLGRNLTKGLKISAVAAGGAIAGVLGTAVTKGFSRLEAIDQAEAKLKGLGHNADSVTKIMENAGDAVKGTAYGLGEAATVAAQMSAAGVASGKDLTASLTLIGDTATIAGSSMGEMGSIFSKVAGVGKLTGESMAQLQERGIPVLANLAEHYGVTAEEAQKMVSEGKVSFEEFSSVMQSTLGGAALESGKTFQGSLANMGASLGRLGETLIGPIFAAAPAIFGNLTTGVDGLNDAVGPLAESFGNWLAPRLETISEKVRDLLLDLPAMWENLKSDPEAQQRFNEIKDAVVGLGNAAVEAGPALGNIAQSGFVTSLSLLSGILNALMPIINGFLIPALTNLSTLLSENEGVATALGIAFVGLYGANKVSSVFNNISSSAKSVKDGFNTAKDAANSLKTGFTAVSQNGATASDILTKTGRSSAGIKGVSGAVGVLSAKMAAFGATLLANPITWIVAGIIALGVALWAFFTKTETGREMWEKFTTKLSETWETVKTKFMEVWDSYISPVLTWLQEKAQSVFGWLSEVALPKVMSVFSAIGSVMSWVWNSILSPIWTVMKVAFALLMTALFAAWEYILKPAFKAIGSVFSFIWNTILLPAWNAMKAAWQLLMTGIKIVWETILKPAWEAIKSAFLTLWNNHLKPAFDSMKEKWDSIISKIKEIWETKLKPAWEDMKQKIKDVIDNHVKPKLETMREAFGKVKDFIKKAVDAIKKTWNKLKSILAKPINFLIGTVWNKGILATWRNAAKFLPIMEAPGDMAKIPEFNRGGPVHGPGTGTSDSIAAWLSNGEHVLTAKEVQALGGHAGVKSLRNLALSGGLSPCVIHDVVARLKGDGERGDIGGRFAHLPGFKTGGPVILDKSKMKKETPAWMTQLNRGHEWAKSRNGRPYVWGGSAHGSSGTDCSGFMSGIADVILGGNGARQWSTHAFPPGPANQPWAPGLGQGFSIFSYNGGPGGGHTAGTLSSTDKFPAVNVESGGANSRVKYGTPDAAGADSRGPNYHLRIGADGAFEPGGSAGISPEEKKSRIKEKIQEFFDRIMQPIKDSITAIVGPPDTVIKEIPHKFLDTIPQKFLDEMFEVVEKLDDLLHTVYDKAKDFTSFLIPSFLRDSGGILPTGTSMVQNNTGSPEFVLTMKQFKTAQDVLRRMGQPALADNLGNYVGSTDEPEESTLGQIGTSAKDWALNDFFNFVGLGGKDNLFTDPKKSLAGTVIDMAINPHKYQRTKADANAGRASDEDTVAVATEEAVSSDTSRSSVSGIDEDKAHVADYEVTQEKVDSEVNMPSVDDDVPAGEGVERFRNIVKQLLDHYGHPASWVENTLRRMNQESQGNVDAINKWDSNWSRGTPSVGLMQVIGPTYQAHKDAEFDKGPYKYNVSTNPAANLAASMRYTMKTYGSLPAGYDRPGGYRTGGWIKGAGSGISDIIPIMASAGEYMVKASAAKDSSMLLNAINSGRVTDANLVRNSRPSDVTPAGARSGDSPLLNVETIITNDDESAVRKFGRYVNRASRSAGLHGGR